QALLEVRRRSLIDGVQFVPPTFCFVVLASLLLRACLDDLDAEAFGQLTDCFHEAEALELLDELDGVTRSMAAKTIVESTLVVDVETRRLLLVERTQAREATPAALELDALANHGRDLHLVAHALNRLRGDHGFGL